ncbi:Nucleoside-diphosphate-sugar pyrophosphorylase involved in lipopolysaccharide biosynthesis/translation initiation factor 2B [Prochlorococcus marinus str. MIT 9321]|uniref:Nucleoside-diphosphate-sugar pyrophosphorylase involved in lipopolysaccharide biosynthesis/translation initiation factor 2B n=1 Tax=Prochlorococcus marinus str. MIT 9401 TaxID=167551 RepID=A0A0A2B8J5_PROMR|nr:Nucleoside-diphosphate-sugar pyrophosphorylase involved in lipopolysaccharide biosynthesis/translation initiation factor 2B [Prochlorococcus marinus str. MIT 9321]KGG06619.1 Nucleoside-diphosphate-sugar pyrophosphorylase involved in lipopolysaccharide biosynthesis/translation initiation factor 2B [Prochlorococcus marinus str. MIT 9322]KGG10201.1 Nucleoside-diphosphate-sugar pyrophosphorylase involved in lipopolysaccharide biosynthesis/translation initiation factor 2B [Prochlorococcus marinus s
MSFDAKQKLKLSVKRNKEYLSSYLLEEERVVGAMLDSKKLVLEGEGRYKYTVTSFKVFQLDINPVVLIAVDNKDGILRMSALESTLDGLGIIDDFNLILKANLEATDVGLEGEALLGVSVSQPPLLKLVPKKILESTGHSVLNGILLGIKARVQQQLVKDFLDWCELKKI